MDWDVFNGDADGICALHQWRLADPRASELVTGVKRDIQLLERAAAQPGDSIAVFDISIGANLEALHRLLDADIAILWFDHHHGTAPSHPRLAVHIDTQPSRCTSLIVNEYLKRQYEPWAIAAAYGDNLVNTANVVADGAGLDERERAALNELGVLLNYNAYGDTVDDLLMPPATLYQRIRPHASPFDFIARESGLLQRLRDRYASDLVQAETQSKRLAYPGFTVSYLPDADWARRISGVFANQLAREAPEQAHAVLLVRHDGSYKVGLRAPLNNPQGADGVCLKFPKGGGRCGAAGIPRLPAAMENAFVAALCEAYP